MKWTSEPPKENGFYWYRSYGNPPTIVQATTDDTGFRLAYQIGGGIPVLMERSVWCEWGDKIQEPT